MDLSRELKKNTGDDSWHETDSLRLLPSGSDLVRIAHSTSSPVKLYFTKKPLNLKAFK